MKINYKKLFLFTIVPVLLGALVGILTVPNSNISTPIPPIVFPIVWTILYILMGISSYLIYESEKEIPKIYPIQLGVNLLWPVIFFKLKLFTLAFVWLLLLILLVILMIKEFLSKNKLAGYLQIPYLIWLFVALYLNLTFIV